MQTGDCQSDGIYCRRWPSWSHACQRTGPARWFRFASSTRRPSARTSRRRSFLWSRTLELFDDAGYAGKFLPAGMVAHGAQISTGKEVVARVSFDMLDSRYPYALMIPQSESERVLEEQLAARGVTVERLVELTGFAEKGDKVEVTIKRRTAKPRQWSPIG